MGAPPFRFQRLPLLSLPDFRNDLAGRLGSPSASFVL
jgi:hypothetical protein